MMPRDRILVAMLVIFAAASGFLGTSRIIDYDSAQFALALEQHDTRLHQPQPPGYVVYVWWSTLLRGFFGDAIVSLRLAAIGLLLGAALLLYALAGRAYDRTTARWAVFLFLASPMVLFHGMTTMIYPSEAFASALIGLLAYRSMHGTRHDLKLFAFLAGIVAGLRQTFLIFGLPLLLWVALRPRFDAAARRDAAIAAILGIVCWLLPQVDRAGSLADYVAANLALQGHFLATSPMGDGWVPLEDHGRRIASAVFWGFGGARLLWLAWAARARRRTSEPPDTRELPRAV